MKTSSFYLYQGPGRISIACVPPKHITGFLSYPKLAPGKWLFDAEFRAHGDYRARYFNEILRPLNAQQIWDELYALAADAEPVLLCHEHLIKPGDFCHRLLVAEWFATELGRDVAELELPQHRAQKAQIAFDF